MSAPAPGAFPLLAPGYFDRPSPVLARLRRDPEPV